MPGTALECASCSEILVLDRHIYGIYELNIRLDEGAFHCAALREVLTTV